MPDCTLPTASVQKVVSGEDEYTIRQYRERDREGVLALYQDVLDDGMTDRWFEWKYEDTPYADTVPVYVAEFDGRVVGAGGFWLLDLAIGERSIRAVQPCDAAVAPAHRRNGLYTRILGAGLERFADEGVEIAFDFPNELSKATFEKYGWQFVQERDAYYRVQQPAALLGARANGPLGSVIRCGCELLARGYLTAKSRRDRIATTDRRLDVQRHETVPPATLAAIYRRNVPDRFHAVRDSRFYRWRFDNPQWEYRTYVGWTNGVPVAAIVTGTRPIDGVRTTRLVDIAPLPSGAGCSSPSLFRPVFEAVLEDAEDADLVAAPPSIHPELLRHYGFHRTGSFPLSAVTTPTVHGACSLAADERDAVPSERVELTAADSWELTFCEYDTC